MICVRCHKPSYRFYSDGTCHTCIAKDHYDIRHKVGRDYDMSTFEIAKILGITPQGVQDTLRRATRKFITNWTDMVGENPFVNNKQ